MGFPPLAQRLGHATALLLVAAGFSTPALSQSYDERMASARRDCVLAAKDYPAADQPPATLGLCEARDAYYGFGQPVDYAKARACAYRGRDWGVLAMLYANGLGVKRDFAVARKAVCDAMDAPAETAGRLKHLAAMERELSVSHAVKPYDFCDDATNSGAINGCAVISQKLAAKERTAREADMLAGWPAAQRLAYAPLSKALAAFARAHGGEVDRGGTAYIAEMAAAQDAVFTAFDDLFAQAEIGQLAAQPPERARAADAALNATWKALKATPDPNTPNAVTLADILTAQRAWLKYRDAWVAFGKLRHPEVPAESWITTLTEQRDAQLQELLASRSPP